MTYARILSLAVVALLPAVAACDDDNNGTEPPTEFTAILNGTNEVPPVTTTATGLASLAIEGDQIVYTVNVTDLQNAIVAHIHIAPDTASGPVRLNLCGTGDPLPACESGDGNHVLVDGTNGVTLDITFDSLVSAMRSGNAYVNVHTDDGTGEQNTGAGDMISGEIRGQVVAQ